MDDVKKLLHGMIDALDLPTITFKDLKTFGIRWCNAHLLRLEALGRFPKRYVLSDRTSAWTPRQIMHYLIFHVGLDCKVSPRFECEQWDDDSPETPRSLPSDSENGPYYGAYKRVYEVAAARYETEPTRNVLNLLGNCQK